MDTQTIFAALRDALAELYSKEADAQVVVAAARLDAKRIAFSARAQTNWQQLLTAALNQQRLDALLEVANKAYGDNLALHTACDQYQRFIEQGNHLEASAQLPLEADTAQPIQTEGASSTTPNKPTIYRWCWTSAIRLRYW